MQRAKRPDPGIGGVLLLMVGVGGVAMCITLMYYGSLAVMDVGGYCAEGGPYVIEQHCPEGTIPATMLGVFGLLLFGGIGLVGASKVGGFGWLAIAAWTALFAMAGWGFLQAGLLDPPAGEIVWGFLIPGVIFQLMAWIPAILTVQAMRSGALDATSGGPPEPNVLRGPGQPPRASTPTSRTVPSAGGAANQPSPAEAAELRGIATAMGTVIAEASAEIPADPARRPDGAAGSDEAFSEGTQALLDRLERLADMRDRGLLSTEEYETAKDAVMAELEARQ